MKKQKTDLIKWAKGRFWVITVASLLIGVFGGYNVIKSTVRDLLEKEIDSAKKEMQSASFEARGAGAAASNIVRQAETYGNTVSALGKKAEEVDLQLVTLQQRVQAETSNAKALAMQELKSIAARLATLESLVTNLAKESKENAQLVAKYQNEIATLNNKAESVTKRFLGNANYNVVVAFSPRAEKLSQQVTTQLTQAGFKTSSTSLLSALLHLYRTTPFRFNSIVYYAEAASKVREIQDLLAPLVHIKESKEVTPFFQPGVFSQEISGSNTISIILVEDK